VKTRRPSVLFLVIMALFLLAFAPMAIQRFDWVVTKRLTVQRGGSDFQSNIVVSVPTVGATTTPAMVINQAGQGRIVEFQDAGTPVWGINDGGDVEAGEGDIDLNGRDLIIDEDGDTVLGQTGSTDDQADVTLGGSTGIFGFYTGNVKVGNGTPTVSQDGEDLYVNGQLEIDGEAQFDGAVDANSTSDFADTATFSKGTGNALVISAGGAADINGAGDFSDTLTLSKGSGNALVVSAGGAAALNGDLSVDGTSNLDDVDIDLSAALNIDGHMVDIGAGSYANADGDDDIGIAGDAEVDGGIYGDGVLDVAGNAQLTGTLNTDGAVTFNSTLDLDGNLTSGTGAITVADGLVVDGGLTDIGIGSYATANGDDDLGIAGDLEVDGSTDLDGAISIAGAIDANSTSDFGGNVTVSSGNLAVSSGNVTVSGGDVTLNAAAGNGNGAVKNEYTGLPRVTLAGGAQGTNPGSQTIDLIDDSPTGEFEPVDADVTEAEGSVAGVFKVDSSSYEATFADTAAEDDGFIDADLGSDTAWDDMESVGMWLYITSAATDTLQAGDLQLVLTDDGGDRKFSIPAVSTTETWTWVEVNIATGDLSSISDVAITLTAQGESNLGAFTLYLDEMWVWDAVDEEALSTDILDGGVLSVVDTEGGASLTEWTDYIVHYESGNDFIVYITDQSAADIVALLAY
jgi:cytoskeletal protein CcmA (bactofilin family)